MFNIVLVILCEVLSSVFQLRSSETMKLLCFKAVTVDEIGMVDLLDKVPVRLPFTPFAVSLE